jgi:ribosome-binding ATPase YchF (GTP1/OBG family)
VVAAKIAGASHPCFFIATRVVVSSVIRAAYSLLGLQTYFTAGVKDGGVQNFSFNV